MNRVLLTVLLIALGALSGRAQTNAANGNDLVVSARTQIGQTVGYDPAYRKLDYPGGDVPLETGVCTDVVIRALRAARSLDLQKLVHEDMRANFDRYPTLWGLKRPDRNIDHRRVPNLQTYFKRKGWERPYDGAAPDFAAGDLVTCIVPPNRPHIMIVSARRNAQGVPLVIHNIGGGTREEDRLLTFKITGLYRVSVPDVP